ncbi:MAG: 4-hydroxy-3-methylbut-2-enyl diphosphate reductase [Treponema sp.]|nr:4-hydroxy-3-methylbut-2-enyl diphosphate reductase [Treponema sp.]
MKTIRSDILGFCSGVSRAIKSALDALGAEDGGQKPKKIYSLGPLIHNQIALEQLSQKGLKILQEDQIDCLDGDCIVIVRAHGVSPLVLEKIRVKGAKIIDATCPRVALSQRRAAEFSQKGMFVILTGDKGHAEVKAVEGSALFVGGRFVLVQNVQEAEQLAVLPEMENNSVLLSQTTFSPEEYKKIALILSEKIKGLKVLDTICPATGQRQKALVELAKKVDALVVVGGKKSANSERLYELAKSLKPAAYFVESAEDLPKDFGTAKTIGLTAGASSPDFVIDAVEARIQAM